MSNPTNPNDASAITTTHPSHDSVTKMRKKRNPITSSPTGPNRLSKPRMKRRPEQLAVDFVPPCTVCGKRFWSWKALFGHMRCHPERSWRGINPPTRVKRSNQTRAAVTDRFEPVEYEVASCLILLANCPPRLGHGLETDPMVTASNVDDYVMSSSPDVVGPLGLDLNLPVFTGESDDDQSCLDPLLDLKLEM